MENQIAKSLKQYAHLIEGKVKDFDILLDEIDDSIEVVFIGEATHGTHEFYQTRAELTKRLILEKGFHAVAIEGDWPDAYLVNQYVKGLKPSWTSEEALQGFQRFPQWMWRNKEIVKFLDWLREHNKLIPEARSKIGFYGLDLYSLYTSISVVLNYLKSIDPVQEDLARKRYSCFGQYNNDPQIYGSSVRYAGMKSCEEEVVDQLHALLNKRIEYTQYEKDGLIDEDFFNAVQNARLIKNSEEYYRLIYHSNVSSWNLRDSHMSETLELLRRHLQRQKQPKKVVVWAHNSHVGNAYYTSMSDYGEFNIGQLAKEKYGDHVYSIGFTTYHGSVTAASHWEGIAEKKQIRNAMRTSYENLFHKTNLRNFYFCFKNQVSLQETLAGPYLQRAIGVLYLPESERQSHYFYANITRQFDAVIHYDETQALYPLEMTAEWEEGELAETYPSGM